MISGRDRTTSKRSSATDDAGGGDAFKQGAEGLGLDAGRARLIRDAIRNIKGLAPTLGGYAALVADSTDLVTTSFAANAGRNRPDRPSP